MFDLAEHLKNLRKSKGLTQKELAKKLNFSERGIQRYELGESKPNHDMLIVLADFFDVSLDYLVGRSDDPKRY